MTPEPVPLRVIGPPGTQRVVDGVLTMLALDVGYRIEHHATLNHPPAVDVTEVQPGAVLQLADASVTFYETEHRPVAPTVVYRVEHDGATAALAGYTVPCSGLDALHAGADLYVQTVVRADLVRAIPNPVDDRELATFLQPYGVD